MTDGQAFEELTSISGDVFTDYDSCIGGPVNGYCANYAGLNTPTGMTNPPVQSGNTYECRAYHAFAGYMYDLAGDDSNSKLHFSHALPLPSPSSPCVNAATQAGASPAVADYCDRIMTGICAGSANYTQYSSRAQCLTLAANFPRTSDVEDQSGNTLECRNYHAGAASNPALAAVHCIHSGFNGFSTCGTGSCDSYCNLVLTGCTGPLAQFSDLSSCLAWCTTYPDAAAAQSAWAMPLVQAGNLLACRTYHASVAASSAANGLVHCAHTGPVSATGVCGQPCEGFCTAAQAICTGSNSQYASYAACVTSCNAYGLGVVSFNTTTGNTLGCRVYHLSVAALSSGSANTHCPHIGASPTAYCVGGTSGSTGGGSMTGTGTMTPSTGVAGASGLQASIGLVAALAIAALAL
jgi:hypothetical protein